MKSFHAWKYKDPNLGNKAYVSSMTVQKWTFLLEFRADLVLVFGVGLGLGLVRKPPQVILTLS